MWPSTTRTVETEAAERLMLKFDRICRDSLGAEESVELISAIAEGLR